MGVDSERAPDGGSAAVEAAPTAPRSTVHATPTFTSASPLTRPPTHPPRRPAQMFLLNVVHTLPYAAIGLPVELFAVFALMFGMANTAGHSGWAGGGKGALTHNAHHVWPFCNFGNFEIWDKALGTFWEPGMPPPKARRGAGLAPLD
jgi:sterol desaturase/sphingolipid hydroxylase (fatty acid hydroxylase superfamily)